MSYVHFKAVAMSKETKYCSNCGEEVDVRAEVCPECGVRIESRSLLSSYIEVGWPASTAGAGALVGGLIVIIGVFSPWVSVLGISASGLEYEAGVLCLVLSFFLMGLVILARWSWKTGGVVLFLSLLMFLLVRSAKIVKAASVAGSIGGTALGSLEWGLGLTVLGIIVVAVSGIVGLIRGG